jgi:hypothetical protein
VNADNDLSIQDVPRHTRESITQARLSAGGSWPSSRVQIPPRTASPTKTLLEAFARLVDDALASIRVAHEIRQLFEFCSGLVDLVVCVRRHGSGGHRLTLAGDRLVGQALVAF